MAPDSVGDIGKRVRECPAGALSLLGREMSVAEVIGVVRRDISYYRDTGGGVTLSGGEPLTQPEFALALADAARAEGISVAIETSCAVPESVVVRFADACIDLFLCGIKASRADYQRLIGVDPDLVLKNIFTLAASGRAVTLRVPCVVGLNFNEGLAEFINEAAAIKGVGGVELLPYHNFGRGKATMAGLPEPDWSEMRAPDEEELVEFARGLKLPGKR
jgi:pyruvate formate lyase activating enzyme